MKSFKNREFTSAPTRRAQKSEREALSLRSVSGFTLTPMRRCDLRKQGGFTLIELLIAISIVAVLSGIGMVNYFGTRNRIVFEDQVSVIVADLQSTRERSRVQEGGEGWGIHFDNPAGTGSDFYDIWYGASYGAGTIASHSVLSQGVEFTTPGAGSTLDVVFAKATGLPIASSTINIRSTQSGATATIDINVQGRVDYTISAGGSSSPPPGTITFVANSISSEPDVTALTPSIPTGSMADDFMIAFCYNSENASAKVWDNDGGGGGNSWIRLAYQRDTSGRDRETALYYKKHDGSESDPTFTIGGSSGSPTTCMIEVYRGVDTSVPFDVTYSSGLHFAGDTNDTTPNQPDITTVTDGAMVVIFHAATHEDITAVGAPSNYTLREASLIPGSSNDHRQAFAGEREIVSAGTETIGSWTHTSSPTNLSEYHVYTIALRPAGG